MRHDYYSAGRRALEEQKNIPLEVFDKPDILFAALAAELIGQIQVKKENCVIIWPVGPVGHYPYFVERVNSLNLSLSHVWFINMDEYLTDDGKWIDPADPLSFRGFMEREVYGKIRPELLPPPQQRVFPDPSNPKAVPVLIKRLGGVDLVVGGIGINGHIAFNEPQPELTNEQFLALETRVLPIAPETRAVNSVGDLNGALEDMPSLCVSVGIAEIFGAKRIRLGGFRDWHRAVVRRACFGQPSAAFPVTLLQAHMDCRIMIPASVAELP